MTEPMFDTPKQGPLKRVAKGDGSDKPIWSVYRTVIPVKCDDCLALHVKNPRAPLARFAHWKRRSRKGDRLLCYEHAQHWREADHLPELKRPRIK